MDGCFKSGEWVVLVDDLDPQKRTESTTRRVGSNSAALADEAKLVLKQFKAKCYCDAMQQSNEAQGFESYDLFFCKEDKAKGYPVCPHFQTLMTQKK